MHELKRNRAERASAFIARYVRDIGHPPATWMVALHLDTTPKDAGRVLREMTSKPVSHQAYPRQ